MVSESNTAVSRWNSRILGWYRCSHCGAPVTARPLLLGGMGMTCRRCCWWRIDHPDGRIEEKDMSASGWLDYGTTEIGLGDSASVPEPMRNIS